MSTEVIKDCKSCYHNQHEKNSIDDCPAICWDCTYYARVNRLDYFPCWTPIEEEEDEGNTGC